MMVLSMTACGGGNTATTAAPAETKAEETTAAEAKEESKEEAKESEATAGKAPEDYSGTVVVYSPHDADPLNAGVNLFMEKYPNVKVEVVAAGTGELCDRIASMENLLSENISRQSAPQENTHVPMTVQEACEYLRMPLSTFYYKVKKDNIPVIKQGKHLYIYRDELDKWLESSRKTPPAQSFEEENEAMVASHRRKPTPQNW